MRSEAFYKFLFVFGKEIIAEAYCESLWKISEAAGMNFT